MGRTIAKPSRRRSLPRSGAGAAESYSTDTSSPSPVIPVALWSGCLFRLDNGKIVENEPMTSPAGKFLASIRSIGGSLSILADAYPVASGSHKNRLLTSITTTGCGYLSQPELTGYAHLADTLSSDAAPLHRRKCQRLPERDGSSVRCPGFGRTWSPVTCSNDDGATLGMSTARRWQ